MPVPTSGNFSMFGTSNTTIQGAIVEGGASGASSATDFNTMKALADPNKFNETYAGEIIYYNQVTSSIQFRGYPQTSKALSIGTNLGSGFANSSTACTSAGNIGTVYVSDGGIQSLYSAYINGKKLWSNSTLTTTYNGNNLWFKTSDAANEGDVFQVGTDGFISSWGGSCVIATTPTISCNNSTSYEGQQTYPTEYSVSLGSTTGGVSFTIEPQSVPDRFIVNWNGANRIDTGYRGDTRFNFGGVQRGDFTASLAGKTDPILSVTYPNTTNFPQDGYPLVSAPTSFSFTKTSSSPTYATVKVYAPAAGTRWSFNLGCPDGIL